MCGAAILAASTHCNTLRRKSLPPNLKLTGGLPVPDFAGRALQRIWLYWSTLYRVFYLTDTAHTGAASPGV